MQIKATYSDIWKIGYPIMLGNMAHGITQAIDYAFMGHVGKNDLNGTLMAGMAYFLLVIIVMGFTRGAQIIIARRTGENNYKNVGYTLDHLLKQGLVFGIFIIVCALLLRYFGLDMMLASDNVLAKAQIYLDYRIWSTPLVVFNLCLIAFYTGIGKTKVVTAATVAMSAANILFDYLLIFGNLGFPEMGIAGASLATVIAESAGTLTLIAVLIINKDAKTFNLFQFPKTNWSLMGKMANLSAPIVFQHFIGFATWWLLFLMIEKISEEALAISGIVKSLYMLIGIPIWGFASAVNTIVSNLMGQKKIEDVIPAVKKSVHISFSIAAVMCLIVYLLPNLFLGFYTDDVAMITAAVPTLNVILFVMLLFAIGAMPMHAIMGIGDTKSMLVIEIICIASYFIYAYCSIFVWQLTLHKVWFCELIYWILLPLLSISYLAAGKWKTSKKNF